MTWLTLSAEERATIEDIGTIGSDRAVAIVAAAILEDRLAEAIKRRLQHDKNIFAQVFRASGPLGSFSAKIDLGFLMGLYSKQSHSDLNAIREIRNEFAHRVQTRNFRSQRVHDLCMNIDAAEANFMITPIHKKDGNAQELFSKMDKRNTTYPRDRYVRACQVFLLRFMIAIRKRAPRAPSF